MNLDFNSIKRLNQSNFANVLRYNKHITSLSLRRNRIKDREKYFAEFCESLAINTILKELNLQGNRIGDKGAIMLAKALKINKSLTMLNVEGNWISEKGTKILEDAASKHPALKTLLHDNIPLKEAA